MGLRPTRGIEHRWVDRRLITLSLLLGLHRKCPLRYTRLLCRWLPSFRVILAKITPLWMTPEFSLPKERKLRRVTARHT